MKERPFAALHKHWGIHSPSVPGFDAYVYSLFFSLLYLGLPYIIAAKHPIVNPKIGSGRK